MPDEWRGGLIQNQTDRAGLAYKRNRYYDPSTGRFTQVDPIGIAGGTNVYGFANGDPVNYGDPFGLCPPCSLGHAAMGLATANAARAAALPSVVAGAIGQISQIPQDVVLYGRGNALGAAGSLEADLSGRAAIRGGVSLSQSVNAAAVGVRVDLDDAPAGSTRVVGSARLATVDGANLNLRVGTAGGRVTDIALELQVGTSLKRLPVNLSVTPAGTGMCSGSRCGAGRDP